MNIEKSKQINISELLQKLNISPVKISGNNYYYIAPYRTEKTASLHVVENKFYDFGIQRGGYALDIIIEMYGFSVSEALQFLKQFDKESSIFSFQKQKNIVSNFSETESKVNIVKVIEIQHFALKQYLTNRAIHYYKNEPNLKEVHYEINGKKYFALGFENRNFGYQLRSNYTKINIGKKDITLIVKGYKNKLRIFEGFFDYLSFINKFKSDSDFLILNSIALTMRSDEILSNYDEIELYFDNDAAGDKYTEILKSKYLNVIDMRSLFFGYKDLNEWLVNGDFNLKE